MNRDLSTDVLSKQIIGEIPMKPKRKDIKATTRCQPKIRFEEQRLTSFAGIILFDELFRALDLKKKLRACFSHLKRTSLYGFNTLGLVILVHLILGWKRLREIVYYDKDPLVNRVVGLKKLPTVSTLSRFFKETDERAVEKVGTMVTNMVKERMVVEDFPRVTLDFDGSVITTKGRNIEGTAIGFNKKSKGNRSYYPIFCTFAQAGQVFKARQRAGNVHDSNGSHPFIRESFQEAHSVLPNSILEARLDSAHFSDKTLLLLEDLGVEFSASVPFERLPELKTIIESRKRWRRIDKEWSFFDISWKPKSWKQCSRFLLFRKKKRKPRKGPIQLDLFRPTETVFEYKAVVTNKKLTAKGTLLFHNGRGSQEGLFAELKTQCQMGYIPTRRKAGNTLWLHLTCLAHNLNRELQMRLQDRSSVNNPKRACMYVFEQIHSFRRRMIQRAGRLTRPSGVLTLTISATKKLGKEMLSIMENIAA
jgi:hypothetical protein